MHISDKLKKLFEEFCFFDTDIEGGYEPYPQLYTYCELNYDPLNPDIATFLKDVNESVSHWTSDV